jgi:hypothetical protein
MIPIPWMWGVIAFTPQSFSAGRCHANSWEHAYDCSVGEDYDSYVFSYRSISWKAGR